MLKTWTSIVVTRGRIKHKNILPLRQNKIVSCREQYCRVTAWALNSISGKRLRDEKNALIISFCPWSQKSKFPGLDVCWGKKTTPALWYLNINWYYVSIPKLRWQGRNSVLLLISNRRNRNIYLCFHNVIWSSWCFHGTIS